MLTTVADSLSRGVHTLARPASLWRESTVRLGVTGLSRSGKTVFITSLIANLMDTGRMPQLTGATNGRIELVYPQRQPNDTLARFDYETHLAQMLGTPPRWPESTRALSELRLSVRLRPRSMMGGTLGGGRVVHLDILDYPGEWLMDLELLSLSYDAWAAAMLERLERAGCARAYLAALAGTDPDAALDEPQAQALAKTFSDCVNAMRARKLSCRYVPGRFLLPGDLEGAPVLTFAPLGRSGDGLGREFRRRYEAYKNKVVKAFMKNHIASIDRQVILIDVLGALADGPQATDDLRHSMAAILGVFNPGRRVIPGARFFNRKVERILFAATKADRVHHSHHGALTDITGQLLRSARDRAQFAGAQTGALALAGLRATIEERITHEGRAVDAVRGYLPDSDKSVVFHPGAFPDDPGKIVREAQQGKDAWSFGEISDLEFSPAPLNLKAGEGPPHIRLDRAVEFLIGDKIR